MNGYLKKRIELKENIFKLINSGQAIDLVQMFKYELKVLNLNNDLYAIARYIYIRLGELFEYDASFEYAEEEKKEEIKNYRVNIRKVIKFSIVCDAYASMYVELLGEFGIPGRIQKTPDGHVYVIYTIENKEYLADLTSQNKDITRIKFGMNPIYNRQISPEAPRIDHTFDSIDEQIYKNGITTEEVLTTIKQELTTSKKIFNWNEEEYIYYVFKSIENIMNFPRDNIGFISGVTYIYYLLQFFIEDYTLYNTHFIDEENNLKMEIFSVPKKGKICYFAYQENEKGQFELKELSKEEFKIVLENYSTIINKEHLFLR